MLQKARDNTSKSFLREIENALLLIKNDKAREYFLEKFQEIFEKRKLGGHTGEKNLKNEILAYLKRNDEFVQTANVWARNIILDKNIIDDFLKTLQENLLYANCEGILEIHLQDREINSPHIQFVGTKARKAEMIIAREVVSFKFENNIESALGKKHYMPHFLSIKETSSEKPSNTNENILDKKNKILESEINELLENLDKNIEIFRKNLENFKAKNKITAYRINLTKQNISKKLNQHRMRLRMLRKR